MANKAVFNNTNNNLVKNKAGGSAYALKDREALAQLATTGCISDTFYASAKDQLNTVLELANRVSASKDGNLFLAQLAVYARQQAYMKDMPALLLSILAMRDPDLYEKVFSRVMDNAKMVRNHIQIVRSGQIDGRKSMPKAMQRQLKAWFANRNSDRLFKDSVGKDPSMKDMIAMVRPAPQNAEQEALYAYLIGREVKGNKFGAKYENLPQLVLDFESTKKALLNGTAAEKAAAKVPDVPFQMLDSLGLSKEQWTEIAKNARWQMTRMNLNTFKRHGVLDDKKMVKMIADRLRDPKAIKYAKAFPYQLMSAYVNTSHDLPKEIREALQDALDVSVENVPEIKGNIYIFPDISGSMSCPVTGYGRGRASAVRCVDVAALVSAAFLNKNKNTTVIPVDERLHHDIQLNPRDSVMTNAKRLADRPGGGTYTSLGLKYLVKKRLDVDLVIYVSDYQSWMGRSWGGRTDMANYWKQLKRLNPNAKMVCIDIQPYGTAQAETAEDVLNIGGFSDSVWGVIESFALYGASGEEYIKMIEQVDIG